VDPMDRRFALKTSKLMSPSRRLVRRSRRARLK
jgi:hypothetical protein